MQSILPWCLVLLLIVTRADTVAAVEPLALNLFAKDSFVGWQHGGSTSGWQMQGKQLTGTEKTQPLVGGWTFGQGELSFQWTTSEGGELAVTLLPASPDAAPVVIHLSKSAQCGRITQGEEVLAPGKSPASTMDELHRCTLRRWQDELQVEVNHQTIAQCPLPVAERYGLQLSVPQGTGSIVNLQLDEPLGIPIFNGVDLTGWHTPGNRDAWEVRDGEIWGLGKRGQYLQTDKQWENYTLSLEYKLQRRGNSGIGIRTPRGGWPSADGMELQFYDEPEGTPLHRGSTLSIYGNVVPLSEHADPEGWNRVVVQVHGHMITAWMNGELAQHVNGRWSPELRHRNLHGWIGLQDHGDQVRFRNVTVQPLPAGPGPAQWYATPPTDVAHRIWDSVMNTTRLATPDNVTASYIPVASTAEGEKSTRTFPSSGAITRLSWPPQAAERAELTLYSGGAKEPLFHGTPAEFIARFPGIASDPNEWIGYLSFQHDLQIELIDPSAEDWLVEIVHSRQDIEPNPSRQPEHVPSSDPAESHALLQRELVPAMEYRISQFRGGRHRDHAPYPTYQSEPLTLAPGEQQAVAACDGAGTAVWWKIVAPQQSLTNDDLWVKIFVDGEQEAAVSAPLRLLFAGLTPGNEWPNLVMLYDNGYTSYLALPFSAGLKIMVENRGSQPLENVSGAISVAPPDELTQAAITGNWRLRSHLVRDVSGREATLNLPGAGRLIGLVLETEHQRMCDLFELTFNERRHLLPLGPWLGILLDDTTTQRHPLGGFHERLAWRYALQAPLTYTDGLSVAVPQLSRGQVLALTYSGAADAESTDETPDDF